MPDVVSLDELGAPDTAVVPADPASRPDVPGASAVPGNPAYWGAAEGL